MENVTRQQTELLEPFVLRARRIAAHSLAADREAFTAFGTGSMKIELRPDEGKAFITQTMPPEEQLESTAARVRPLILQTESTYLDKVLKTVAFLVGTTTTLIERDSSATTEETQRPEGRRRLILARDGRARRRERFAF